MKRIIERNELDMLCYIMISFDPRDCDQNRLASHMKAVVLDDGVLKETFFQDIIIEFVDFSIIEVALDITQKNHPYYSKKIKSIKGGIKEWILANGGIINKNTTANMFSVKAR